MTRARALLVLLLLFTLLPGCGGAPSTPTPTPIPTPEDNARPEDIAKAFLNAWMQARYADMYLLLTAQAKASMTEGEFVQQYRDLAAQAKLTAIEPQLISLLAEETQAKGRAQVRFTSQAAGEFEREAQITLQRDPDGWRVSWSPKVIMAGLEEGDSLQLLYQPSVRGNIYDQTGHALAGQDVQVTVGVVPALIEDEQALLDALSRILEMTPEDIRNKYKDAARLDWFMPVADITPQQNETHYDELSILPGVSLREKPRRSYPDGPLAAHILGYVGEINEEELSTWHVKGYQSGDIIGKSGLEAWAEPYLAGQRGAQLVVMGSIGQVREVLAQKAAVHSRNVVVSLDMELQRAATDILGEQLGAIVALDPRGGSILALVSFPSFDPNAFVGGISADTWAALTSDSRHPLLDRTIQAVYPSGSIFKVVTMAAALEKAGYGPASSFTCTGSWNGLGNNWIKTCYNRAGHGTIDLVLGLTESCDVVFYTLGKALYDTDAQALPDMARAFGLGSPTGVDLTGEAAGLVPDEAWKLEAKGEGWYPGDNVNLAIGQGDLLVTPLQMAVLYAAIANGGTLYQPHVVAEIPAWTEGQEDIVVGGEEIGKLPVSAENLQSIRQGLEGVTQPPYGTSWRIFTDMPVAVAGKSGTAENNFELPHSWWVGYAPSDNPEIVVLAVIENSGEGSKFAGPVVRKVMDAWYQIRTQSASGQ